MTESDDKPVFRPAGPERWDDTMTGSLALPMGDRWIRAVREAVASPIQGMPARLTPGTQLGRWTLVSRIGRGGAADAGEEAEKGKDDSHGRLVPRRDRWPRIRSGPIS